jgi:hypothetical protein
MKDVPLELKGLPLEQRVIIAVDPGKMTGWAHLRLGMFNSGQMPLSDYLVWFDQVLEEGLQPTVVCEDFIYTTETAKKTRQTWSTEGIGVLRFLTAKYGFGFHVQTPADAKRFSTNAKLKAMEWYRPSKGGHANDAARHLLLYCVKNKLIDPRPLLEIQPDQTEET